VADVGPQLVALDPLHVQADHHAVVHLGGATANREREARDRLAVGISQARDGTLADALTERGDDLNLLFAGEVVHGGPNPSFGTARSETLEKQRGNRYICLMGHCFGAKSRGFDPDRRCATSVGPLVRSWQPRRDSDPDLPACKSGRPTVRPRGTKVPIRGRFSAFRARKRPRLSVLAPRVGRQFAGARYPSGHDDLH
jgi:hypothetical protein